MHHHDPVETSPIKANIFNPLTLSVRLLTPCQSVAEPVWSIVLSLNYVVQRLTWMRQWWSNMITLVLVFKFSPFKSMQEK